MHKIYQNRLLVAVDGSERSLQTVQCLGDISSLRTQHVNLFHVFNTVPESYDDLAVAPDSLKSVSSLQVWEVQQRKEMKKYLNQCRQLLLAGDFPPDQVTITIQDRRAGIARDIIAEARSGYDALVLHRRGMGRLHGLALGSVACKLLNRLDFVPLVYAGRKPFDHRVVIALDGSAHAMRAVAFVGEKLMGSNCSIRLIHVLRGDLDLRQLSADMPDVQETFDCAEKQVAETMDKARSYLICAGFAPESVTMEIVKHAPSRSGAILKAAAAGNYSTIAMGRKGMSRVREFAIGRVSSKVLQIGQEFGVWIVQ